MSAAAIFQPGAGFDQDPLVDGRNLRYEPRAVVDRDDADVAHDQLRLRQRGGADAKQQCRKPETPTAATAKTGLRARHHELQPNMRDRSL